MVLYGQIPALIFLLNMGIYLDRTLILVLVLVLVLHVLLPVLVLVQVLVPFLLLFFNIYVLFRYRIGTGRV